MRGAATRPDAASDQVQTKAAALISNLPGGMIEALHAAFDPAQIAPATYSNQDAINLFVHIPKTAGSALLFGLRDGFDGVTPVPFDRAPEALNTELTAALAAPAPGRSRIFIGHFGWNAAQPFLQGNANVRAASMIRNPADRLVSQYLYNGSAAHPAHKSFRQKHPTFDSYLEAVPPNAQLRQLAGTGGLAAQIPRLVQHYSFLGVTEHFAVSLAHYSRSHGLREMREHVVNVAPKTPWREVELTGALREKIYLKHMGDWALYTVLEPMFRAARI